MSKRVAFLGGDTESFFEQFFVDDERGKIIPVPVEQADYVFYSNFVTDHHALSPDVIRIMITGENICPDFNACDYAISSQHLEYSDRHFRAPVYCLYGKTIELGHRSEFTEKDLLHKNEFCNFIYSNSNLAHPIREDFFRALDSRIPVISAGRFLQNDRSLSNQANDLDWHSSKLKFQHRFRFTIAIENSGDPGYITEKLTDAFLARTIPIYWGDPCVAEEFNPQAFIDLRSYENLSAAVDDILHVNQNLERILEILNAPVFNDGVNKVNEFKAGAQAFLQAIFDQPLYEARRRPRHANTQWLEQRRRKDQTGFKKLLKRNRQ